MTNRESHKTARVIWENSIKSAIKKNGKTYIFTSKSFPELEGYTSHNRGAVMSCLEKDGILTKIKLFYGEKEIREYKISETLVGLPIPELESLNYRDAIRKGRN